MRAATHAEKEAAPGARTLAGGFGWETGSLVAVLLLQLGYSAWTGRHLAAGHFGAYATALAIVHTSASLTSGLTQYVLTSRDLGRDFLATALAVAAGTGTLSCLAFEAVAPVWGAVFGGTPHLVDFVRILVLQNLLAPVAAVCTAALRGTLRFRTAALLELAGQAAGLGCALVLLVSGWSPQGIAVAPVLAAVVPCAGGLVLLRGELRSAEVRWPGGELWRNFRSCAAFSLLQSVTYNIPLWSAALLLGAGGAGHFSRAVYFVSMVSQTLTQALVRTSSPAFTRLVDAPERLAGALREALTAASGLLAVCLGVTAGAGPVALLLLLGPGWEEAAGLLVWFVPGLALQALCTVGYQADRVRGDARGVSRAQAAVFAVMAVGAAGASVGADGRVLALVLAGATAVGHGRQLRRWRRLPGGVPVLRIYGVHALVGAGIAAASRTGCAAARWAGAGGGAGDLDQLPVLLGGLAAGALATGCCLPLARWIPALRLASAHGLPTGAALPVRRSLPTRLPHARRRRSTARRTGPGSAPGTG
ncbi:oligosaccharide flippase family protein [Streptomyces sp. NBC_00237]|uniref:oligosaccharide flippase family protein n=1 Tax=Streptomyces sp. NBC_00237 TaxID=2975687 RepID=UPI002B1E35B3|nr:oligosaccharide flippase family protein [Streptomyces sp. NBC_00237]